jgi:hypothetical protein
MAPIYARGAGPRRCPPMGSSDDSGPGCRGLGLASPQQKIGSAKPLLPVSVSELTNTAPPPSGWCIRSTHVMGLTEFNPLRSLFRRGDMFYRPLRLPRCSLRSLVGGTTGRGSWV